jgi:hypothetical protein
MCNNNSRFQHWARGALMAVGLTCGWAGLAERAWAKKREGKSNAPTPAPRGTSPQQRHGLPRARDLSAIRLGQVGEPHLVVEIGSNGIRFLKLQGGQLHDANVHTGLGKAEPGKLAKRGIKTIKDQVERRLERAGVPLQNVLVLCTAAIREAAGKRQHKVKKLFTSRGVPEQNFVVVDGVLEGQLSAYGALLGIPPKQLEPKGTRLVLDHGGRSTEVAVMAAGAPRLDYALPATGSVSRMRDAIERESPLSVIATGAPGAVLRAVHGKSALKMAQLRRLKRTIRRMKPKERKRYFDRRIDRQRDALHALGFDDETIESWRNRSRNGFAGKLSAFEAARVELGLPNGANASFLASTTGVRHGAAWLLGLLDGAATVPAPPKLTRSALLNPFGSTEGQALARLAERVAGGPTKVGRVRVLDLDRYGSGEIRVTEHLPSQVPVARSAAVGSHHSQVGDKRTRVRDHHEPTLRDAMDGAFPVLVHAIGGQLGRRLAARGAKLVEVDGAADRTSERERMTLARLDALIAELPRRSAKEREGWDLKQLRLLRKTLEAGGLADRRDWFLLAAESTP